ncbi:iron-containing alcohol dehydrogenase [Oscillospiraceae bacterium PP1C4]
MNLNFNMPVHLITEHNCVANHAPLFKRMGSKAMLVTGGSSAKRSGALDDVISALNAQNIPYLIFDEVQQNPLISTCKKAGKMAMENGVDFLIGIGGGSPQDATKAIAVFAANDIPDEEIYSCNWENKALPFALVGTTAGTASELTHFSVLTIDRTGRKRSLGCQQTYAAYAFGDAKYTYTLPFSFTLSTTLDALSHAIECYYSTAANACSDLFAIEAVRVLLEVHRKLTGMTKAEEITDELRDALYEGSLLAGFALNHCGTCFCHTMSYFLSEDYDIPHGFACAVTLPDFIERAEQLLPQKAQALYAGAHTTKAELFGIIHKLNLTELPRLTAAEIDDVVSRWNNDIPNFVKTPGGFTTDDAKILLQKHYQ